MDAHILTQRIGPIVINGIQGTITSTPRTIYSPTVEFGAWQRELGATFYAGFNRKPPVYIIIDRTRQADTTVVTIGLDERVSKELLKGVAQSFGLCARTADDTFYRRVTEDLTHLEEMKVEEFTDLSKRTGLSLENSFGMIRYANFLTMQLGMDRDEAMKKALEEYFPK